MTDTALLVLAVPALAAIGWLAARKPAWAMFALVALMAFAGALDANEGLKVRPAIWLLLLGFLAATIAAYLNATRIHGVLIWPGVAALAAYLLFSAVQIPFAETTDIGARAFAAGPAFIIAFFAAAYAPWSSDTRRRVAQALVLVALLAGAYAVFRLIVGPTDAELALARQSAGVAGELALFGSFSGRLELGAWSAIAVPFLFAATLGFKGRWRWLSGAALALMLVALLGSEVRTALVGAAIGIALVAVLFNASAAFRGEAHRALFALGFLAVAGMIGFAATVGSDPESTERFANILTPGEDLSFQARVEKWDVALAEINENPLGQGLGTAGTTQRAYSRTYRLDNDYIDNSYLQLGVQQGYPGWILLGLSLVLIAYLLIRSSVATADRDLACLGIAAVGSLACWLVVLLTGDMLTAWGAVLLWILLGLGVGGFVSAKGGPAGLTRRGT
jgi:hypothetical protein